MNTNYMYCYTEYQHMYPTVLPDLCPIYKKTFDNCCTICTIYFEHPQHTVKVQGKTFMHSVSCQIMGHP